MIDFTPVVKKQMTLGELSAGVRVGDLRDLTNEMIDRMLALIADCDDFDVTFEPHDPKAYDEAAADESELELAWNLGHVIVHATATSEEAAAIAAELARGVPHRSGRSRAEVPWRTVTTIAQCRQRLEESRRIRLASLDMWPDQPNLENTYRSKWSGEDVNAIHRFVGGLMHDDSHLEQIAKIVRQAKESRVCAVVGD